MQYSTYVLLQQFSIQFQKLFFQLQQRRFKFNNCLLNFNNMQSRNHDVYPVCCGIHAEFCVYITIRLEATMKMHILYSHFLTTKKRPWTKFPDIFCTTETVEVACLLLPSRYVSTSDVSAAMFCQRQGVLRTLREQASRISRSFGIAGIYVMSLMWLHGVVKHSNSN